jgi:ornithine carbamoyltransferase
VATKVTLRELGPTGVAEIMQIGKSVMEQGFGQVSENIRLPSVIGSAFYNASRWDSTIASITAGRLGCSYVDFPLEDEHAMSSEEILEQIAEIGRVVDILLTAHVDTDSFGAGRLLTMRFPAHIQSPLISVRDDIYAHQPGLAELLGLSARLGGLEKRRIVVSWGFGSQFVLPNTAHSLLILALSMGSNVRVVSPSGFSLLRRVISEASSVAKSENAEFEEVRDFEGSFKDADAVFVSNWCRLDDFNHPERFASLAAEFRDWHFTPDTLPQDCIFTTESPAESDLLAAPDLIHGGNSLVPSWLVRRVSALAASIAWILQKHREGKHVALV